MHLTNWNTMRKSHSWLRVNSSSVCLRILWKVQNLYKSQKFKIFVYKGAQHKAKAMIGAH